MAAPKTPIWSLDPHTRAKHAILRRYLEAWTPILTQGGFPKIAYIDGFAGPGRYIGGEDGSPIIAIKAALAHSAQITGRVIFWFVEKDSDRAQVLQGIVDTTTVPSTFTITVDGGRTFEESFRDFCKLNSNRYGRLPPTFAFIDPFGWTGAPFAAVNFILGQPSCEVFVTFMYEEINRFIDHPDQTNNFDAMFGTNQWRKCQRLVKPNERQRCLHDVYLRQLRNAAKFVRSFQMRNEAGRTDYFLFYATNNLMGLRKMKEAMWKVDQSGGFTFSDATDPNQTVLFGNEPRYDQLRRQIMTKFSRQDATVEQIELFVLAETAFRETHYKQHVLKQLETADPPQIEILDPPTGRRRGTFASPTMRIRFK